MPRVTYHDRFADLLAKEYVSDRDRAFAESLYASYKHKKSLTPGRRRCFLQLEERYAVRPVPAPGAEELDVVLTRIQDTTQNDWDFRFVNSIRTQLLGGRELSERQRESLEKIKDKYNDEAMNARNAWKAGWDETKAERYSVVVRYYARTGYFVKQVRDAQADPSAIPTMDDYERLTENKFAKKVLNAWFASPRFPAGSMVSLGAGATWTARQACPTGMAVVVATNAEVPSSAARGAKVYKLLPVGSARTIICEERALKRARAPKKS